MRILYFSRDYTTHDRRFLLKLAASRHEIWYLRLENDGMAYEQRPLPEGIHCVEWIGGRQPYRTPEEWFRLMPAFESVLERIAPTLVHAGPVQSCGFMTAISGFRPFKHYRIHLSYLMVKIICFISRTRNYKLVKHSSRKSISQQTRKLVRLFLEMTYFGVVSQNL